jgi:hypothetical protein
MTAACRPHVQAGRDYWTSDVEADQQRAKAICRTECELREACLRTALADDEPFVRGGTTLAERRGFALIEPTPARIRQRVRGLAEHGSHARYQTCTDGDDGRACRDCLRGHAAYIAERRSCSVTRPATLVVDQLNLFEESA